MSNSFLLTIIFISLLLASSQASPFPLASTKATSRLSERNDDDDGGSLGDKCSTTSDCSSSFECTTFAGAACTEDDDNCLCLPFDFETCDTDADCDDDEECKRIGDVGSVCVPKIVAAVVDLVCVDATALQHLAPHELVFDQHQMSRVLCDASGSCATKGHIVTYKGRAMMMKSYCDIVECEERVMKVNSPSYRVGLRVLSKTEGLEYTAFAARYETRAEEASMAAAVRMGL